MGLSKLYRFLESHMGLDIDSIGEGPVKALLKERMQESEHATQSSYIDFLLSSAAEKERFIEGIVVPETWFFRDKTPFQLLVNHVNKEWFPKHQDDMLRILCVPCSTGEEPYSIAMSLVEAQVSQSSFMIDAFDISRNNIKVAQLAQYSEYSFRGVNSAMRRYYFDEIDRAYHLKPEIQRCVSFRQHNILDINPQNMAYRYDIIFCRNLLIYFDQKTKIKVIDIFRQIISDDGMLFVGHAEQSPLFEQHFKRINRRGAFAYNRVVKDAEHKRLQAQEDKTSSSLKAPKKSRQVVKKKAAVVIRGVAEKNGKQGQASIKDIKKMADQGRVYDAIKLCKKMLDINPESKEVFYLMGLLYDTSNNREMAIECMRKAIYLAPSYYEALLQMALFLEADGDKSGAARIMKRAHRAAIKQ